MAVGAGLGIAQRRHVKVKEQCFVCLKSVLPGGVLGMQSWQAELEGSLQRNCISTAELL